MGGLWTPGRRVWAMLLGDGEKTSSPVGGSVSRAQWKTSLVDAEVM